MLLTPFKFKVKEYWHMANPKKKEAINIFNTLEYIIYPPHGVGQIQLIEEQEISGYTLELYIIYFERDKMYVKVPVSRAKILGLRKLSTEADIKKALDTVYSKVKIKRVVWSRRAQEYELKLNSGNLQSIAEVVRDLYKVDSQLTQSYSERQLYEVAIDRLAREISLVQNIELSVLVKAIETRLEKINRKEEKPSSSDILRVVEVA